MGFVNNHRRVLTIGGIVGSTVALGGVAVAAILLTTEVSGKATIQEVRTSNSIELKVVSENGSRLDCQDLAVSRGSKLITFNPKLTKPVGGPNSSNVPIPGGTCTITAIVTNTGDTAIQVDPSSNFILPEGWKVTPVSGDATYPIPSGKEAQFTVTITATDAAQPGPVSGQIVYAEAATPLY